jgi:hypothetical protein
MVKKFLSFTIIGMFSALSLIGVAYSAAMVPASALTFQNGFYAGAAGGVGAISNKSDNKAEGLIGDAGGVLNSRYAHTARGIGLTAGLFIGYEKFFNNKYSLGVELAGYYNSAETKQTDGIVGQEVEDDYIATLHVLNKVKQTYNFDLTILPGVLINNTYLNYLRLGVSLAGMQVNDEETISSTSSAAITNSIYNIPSDRVNVFGGVVGLGARKLLTKNVSVFGEIDHYVYANKSFKNGTFHLRESAAAADNLAQGTYKRKSAIQNNVIRVGFIYNFGDKFGNFKV